MEEPEDAVEHVAWLRGGGYLRKKRRCVAHTSGLICAAAGW